MNVHAPFWSNVLETDGPPGNTMLEVTCVGLAWLPPGATTHTSCGKTALISSKFHWILSLVFSDTASGIQRSPLASTWTVLAAGPPGAWSLAENLTLT